MAENDPAEQVAAMREQLDDKRKIAEEQLSASKERLQDSSATEAPHAPDLRDLLNKLRLALRGDAPVHESEPLKEST